MLNVKNFLQDEEGQSMVEYGVVLGAVAAVSYVAVVQLGDKTADLYAWMANHLPGGEDDEGGKTNQVRVNSDGLVNLAYDAANSQTGFSTADTLAGSAHMLNSLGGNSAIE